MKNGGYVDIMTNMKMGTLYIGSSSNIIKRVWQHKTKYFPECFTAEHETDRLVYYEFHESLENMVKRERQMKELDRNWKLRLIIDMNPQWDDLYEKFLKDSGYNVEMYKEDLRKYQEGRKTVDPGLRRDDGSLNLASVSYAMES